MRAPGSGRSLAPLSVALVLSLAACRDDERTSDTTGWLRAGGFNATPEEIECVADSMDELLSPEERSAWLSRDPERLTVEELQALPRAIAVADRCRHLMPLGR